MSGWHIGNSHQMIIDRCMHIIMKKKVPTCTYNFAHRYREKKKKSVCARARVNEVRVCVCTTSCIWKNVRAINQRQMLQKIHIYIYIYKYWYKDNKVFQYNFTSTIIFSKPNWFRQTAIDLLLPRRWPNQRLYNHPEATSSYYRSMV